MSHAPDTPVAFPALPTRTPDSHKGTYGRCLLVGGSRGMSGAIALTAQAALRSGAGLVTVATPDDCADLVASFNPCYMTIPLPIDPSGQLTLVAQDVLKELRADVVACGPGWGQQTAAARLAVWLYTSQTVPMVVDADGLNALARGPEPTAAGPRVLTPHPGEFRRLAQSTATDCELRDVAVEFAARQRVVLVLKGHRTLVTDGRQRWENSTGNPGMATGGAGDVLTGVITALLGQGLSPFDAARLGVYVHGLAGDLAAQDLGMVSLTAFDLVQYLAPAFRQLNESVGPTVIGTFAR